MSFGRVGNNWNVANIEEIEELMIPMPGCFRHRSRTRRLLLDSGNVPAVFLSIYQTHPVQHIAR